MGWRTWLVLAFVVSACTDGPADPDEISIPATHATMNVPFRLSASASGTHIQNVSIVDDVGTVQLADRPEPISAFAHTYSSYGEYDVFQLLAIEPSRLHVVFLYCNKSDQRLSAMFHEDTTNGILEHDYDATGTCQYSFSASRPTVQFPALSTQVGHLVEGFDVQGQDIQIHDGAPGFIVVEGTTQTLLPFAAVDCTSCASDSAWWELHSILWDPDAQQATFAIIYLDASAPNHVMVTYSLRLPDLTSPAELVLPAHWAIR